MATPQSDADRSAQPGSGPSAPPRVALVGNPNTGKTTLFNRLTGLRHHTSNFPGTTVEARVGSATLGDGRRTHVVDLPGVYGLNLEQAESKLAAGVLAGAVAPSGEAPGAPDALVLVLDATNLARNLVLAGQALAASARDRAAHRPRAVAALNMVDLADRQGLRIDAARLAAALGCEVVPICARSGEGVERLLSALGRVLDGPAPDPAAAGSPRPSGPPATADAGQLRAWAQAVFADCVTAPPAPDRPGLSASDRADRVLAHPIFGAAAFALVMAALFYSIFSIAQYPMGWIDWLFSTASTGLGAALPPGLVHDLLAEGVVPGIGATVIFLPQICLLFFLISLLEDTGYLARAAFVMDRVLRPFGLPGHSFVPLLSAHACALPGIMSTRTIPDLRQRLATILVAPFMTCSARLPVYVLLTGLLFPDQPATAALAFVGCYALGIAAALLSALLVRRTILRGPARAMALELPSYKRPSLRSAALGTLDRGLIFLRKAGSTILAICVVLWWLGSFPRVEPPASAVELRQQAAAVQPADAPAAAELEQQAERLEHAHAKRESYIGRLGRAVQPALAPLGYDWQLTVGVLASFAAREVFVGTMAVLITGQEDDGSDETIRQQLAQAQRDGPAAGEPGQPRLLFDRATSWSLLVFFVLAMQCLPTLVVTARESGHAKWALLQLGWMTLVAYAAAAVAYRLAGGA